LHKRGRERFTRERAAGKEGQKLVGEAGLPAPAAGEKKGLYFQAEKKKKTNNNYYIKANK